MGAPPGRSFRAELASHRLNPCQLRGGGGSEQGGDRRPGECTAATRTAEPSSEEAGHAREGCPCPATEAPLPEASFDAPLHELERDALSVFLYLPCCRRRPRRLVKQLNLSQPGFRQEALGEVQRCDLLADEIRA